MKASSDALAASGGAAAAQPSISQRNTAEIRSARGGLRGLQTDHIDLYQIHRPDPATDIEETLLVLTDLIRSGKVRAIAFSTMPL